MLALQRRNVYGAKKNIAHHLYNMASRENARTNVANDIMIVKIESCQMSLRVSNITGIM